MKQSTIQDIRNIKWVGNHASDAKNFDTVEKFIVQKDPDLDMQEMIEALTIKFRDGMGIPEECSEVDVFEYLEAIRSGCS